MGRRDARDDCGKHRPIAIYQSAGDYEIEAFVTDTAGHVYPAILAVDVAPRQDSAFGSAVSTIPLAQGESLSDLTVQPDGSIVALESGAGVSPASPFIRFDSGGRTDGTTFDDVSGSIPALTALAIQPVSGSFDILAAGSGYCVARFNSDGSLDTTFGGDGIASPVALGQGVEDALGEGGSAAPSSVLVEASGEIVLAGLAPDPNTSGDTDVVLAYFTPGGQPDGTIGTNGLVTEDLGTAATSCDAVEQPGGGIVVAAGLPSGPSELFFFRPGGSLEASVTPSQITGKPLVAVQADGEIDLAGNISGASTSCSSTVAAGASSIVPALKPGKWARWLSSPAGGSLTP